MGIVRGGAWSGTGVKVDLSFGGELDVQWTVMLDDIARESRHAFTEVIRKLSEPNEHCLDWWVEGPASRNTLMSPLFHYCCALRLIERLAKDGERIAEITVDSRAFRRMVKTLLGDRKVCIGRIRHKQAIGARLANVGIVWYRAVSQYCNLLLQFSQARRSRRWRRRLPGEPLILVETYLAPQFVENDRYYPGLWEHLYAEERKVVFFVPGLVGFSIRELRSVYRRLRESGRNFLFKEDFLRLSDYLWALDHVRRVFRFRVPAVSFCGVDVSPLVKEELRSMRGAGSAMLALLNYRFAFRLKQADIRVRRVVDWFENQVVDKGWNTGFQECYPEAERVGYQGFIGSSNYLCMYPTEYESRCGVLPSTVAVPGRSYVGALKEFFSDLEVVDAPAFRFQGVWKERTHLPEPDYFTVLIALPMLVEHACAVLRLVTGSLRHSRVSNLRVWLKAHPVVSFEQVQGAYERRWCAKVPRQFVPVDRPFNDLVERCDVVIGGASSSSLEALAKGVPVIIAGNRFGLTYNPVPREVNEDIWRVCQTAEEVADAIEFYASRDEATICRHKVIAEKIREEYFEPVTRESTQRFLGLSGHGVQDTISG